MPRTPGARLHVGEDAVRIGRSRTEPYVRRARRAARNAALALGRGSGSPVEVHPVLTLVGAARITVSPALEDVRVITEHTVGALGAHLAVLKPDSITRPYAVARDRRTWRGL